jgi:hypothetical protein
LAKKLTISVEKVGKDHRWAKWTIERPLTIFLETLFEDGKRVEGGRGSLNVKNSLYSFVDVSI